MYLTHTVKMGDTIQSIGALYEVEWTKIVELNGLEYPYIDSETLNQSPVDTENKNIAVLDSTIVIPSEGIIIPKKTLNSVDELENYTFGGDLLVVSQDTVVDLETPRELQDNSQGDLAVVEGLSNLHQQLLIRLGTPKGTLLLHPEFGCNLTEFIGRKTTAELLTEISLEVQECLLSDFRVQEVNDLNVEYRDKGIYVEATIVPISPYSNFKISQLYTK